MVCVAECDREASKMRETFCAMSGKAESDLLPYLYWLKIILLLFVVILRRKFVLRLVSSKGVP